MAQVKLLNAELGHEVKITRTDKQHVVDTITAAWQNRKVVTAMQKIFERYKYQGTPPRAKKDRIEALFTLARESF